jgi:hypothetical protein
MRKCAVAPESLTDTHPRQGKKLAHEIEVSDRNWMHHQHDLSACFTPGSRHVPTSHNFGAGLLDHLEMSALGHKRTFFNARIMLYRRKRTLGVTTQFHQPIGLI